jgi:hypothetical protein
MLNKKMKKKNSEKIPLSNLKVQCCGSGFIESWSGALRREHPALQKLNFLPLFLFLWVNFALLDLYPQHCLRLMSTPPIILLYHPRLIRSKHLVNQEAGSLNLIAELPHTPRPSLTRNPHLFLIVFTGATDTDFLQYISSFEFRTPLPVSDSTRFCCMFA